MELSTKSNESIMDLKAKIKDAVKENTVSDTLLSEIKTACQKDPNTNNLIHSYLSQLLANFESNNKVAKQASVNKIKEYLINDDLLPSVKNAGVSDTFEILEPGYDSDENTPGEDPTTTPNQEANTMTPEVSVPVPEQRRPSLTEILTSKVDGQKEMINGETRELTREEYQRRIQEEEQIIRMRLMEEEEMQREKERLQREKVQLQKEKERQMKEEKERKKMEEEQRKRIEIERKHQEKEQRKREEERAKQMDKERREQEKERKEQEKEQRKREEERAKQMEKERKQQEKEQQKQEEERLKQLVRERREHEKQAKKMRKREEERARQLEKEKERRRSEELPKSQEQIDMIQSKSRTSLRQEIELDVDVFKNLLSKVSPKSCGKSPFELGKQAVISDLVDYAFIDTNISELTGSELKRIEQNICAFLNTRGGVIYFGVNRSGITVGDTSGMSAYQKFAMKLAFITEDGIIPALNKNQIKMDILSVHGAEKHSVGMIIVKKGKSNKLYCTSKGKYFFMKDQVLMKYSPQEVQNIIAKNAVDSYIKKAEKMAEKKAASTSSIPNIIPVEYRVKGKDPNRPGEGFIVWEDSVAPKGTWVPSTESSRKGSISVSSSSESNIDSQRSCTPPKQEKYTPAVQTQVTHPQFSLMSILNIPQPPQSNSSHPVGYPLPNPMYQNVAKSLKVSTPYPKGNYL